MLNCDVIKLSYKSVLHVISTFRNMQTHLGPLLYTCANSNIDWKFLFCTNKPISIMNTNIRANEIIQKIPRPSLYLTTPYLEENQASAYWTKA